MIPTNPNRIEPEDFPGNSNRQKTRPKTIVRADAPEAKKVEKVVTGPVIQRKRSLSKRFRDTFMGGDAKSVFAFVWEDIIIPSGRDLFFDAGQAALERSVYGESRGGSRRRTGLGGALMQNMAYHQVNRQSGRPADPRDRQHNPSRRARAMHDFGEIVLSTRREADTALMGLDQLIERYQMASVADLYDMLDIERNYTDAKWGWYDLSDARIKHISGRDGGYLLELPRPEPLE